ncbi:hypothetical protein ACGF8B_00460 [Streptomyces sp. NPDC047917]|uniref:hypothetical protein n=1 Tax=Streptomyces sp. NPDC047917 TaxID=3365491 RepID=UPI00371081FF
MSVGGVGIPRLQELIYVETAARAVAEGSTFEQIRVAIVRRAARHALEQDTTGAYDETKWQAREADPREYVHNTVDALKELMRLGWIERHILPSTRTSAVAHSSVTFSMTPEGHEWTELIKHSESEGFNALAGALIQAHPQFDGYLRLVGARPDSQDDQFTIPLLRSERTDGEEYRKYDSYLDAFVMNVAAAVHEGGLGWSAPEQVIDTELRTYVSQALSRAAARSIPGQQMGATRARSELRTPHTVAQPSAAQRRRRLVTLCEEAAVRLAFGAAGCRLDYISHEVLRRWTRFLGLANFSYYAPGPSSLRLWATSTVTGSGPATSFRRATTPEDHRIAMDALPRIWKAERGAAGQEMYRPVWRIRAAVCWERRISDSVFDAALASAARGEMPGLGFRVHLDAASYGRTPGSARPLVLPIGSGRCRVYHVMRINEENSPDGMNA